MRLSASPTKVIFEPSVITAGWATTPAGNMTSQSDSLPEVTIPQLLLNYLESRGSVAIDVLGSIWPRLNEGRPESISSRQDPHFNLVACPRKITTALRLIENDLEVTLMTESFLVVADKTSTRITARGLPQTIQAASLQGRRLREIVDLEILPEELEVISSNADGSNSLRIVCQGISVNFARSKANHSLIVPDNALSVVKRNP